ncbi:MAG: hypothetical protein ABIS07_11620 [Dokdonella sp.]
MDIETDDLEADADALRLESVSAKRVILCHDRWWVMLAPTGHRFCILRRQRKSFGPHINTGAAA